jgi:hypothetical protein
MHALDLGRHLTFGPGTGAAVAEVAALLYPASDKPPGSLAP